MIDLYAIRHASTNPNTGGDGGDALQVDTDALTDIAMWRGEIMEATIRARPMQGTLGDELAAAWAHGFMAGVAAVRAERAGDGS